MNTSRIVRFEKFGGPEVLNIEELPVERPKAGEVQLKVQAIGLNRADALFRSGNYLEQPIFPSRIGVEAAGIVEALGSDVTHVRLGDRVSVTPGQSIGRYGTYGETAIVPAASVIRYPENLTPQEAASVWVQYLTPYFAFVDMLAIQPAQTVLITAASGRRRAWLDTDGAAFGCNGDCNHTFGRKAESVAGSRGTPCDRRRQ